LLPARPALNVDLKNKEVKLLSIREWVCKNCDTAHQRDENAAKNIAAKGIMELGIVV